MIDTYDEDAIIDGYPRDSSDDPDDDDEGETVVIEKNKPSPTRKAGPGYGRAISEELCPFCHGKGTVVKSRGEILCTPCDGIGTRGGAGKGRHPITLDMIRPYRIL